MASVAVVTIPPDCHITGNPVSKPEWSMFRGKSGVILISLIEMVGSISVMAVYLYALFVEPSWYLSLVPIPSNLCNATKIVHGVMSTIVLLSGLELLLAVHLFEGARQEKLGRIHFWLSAMLMYLALFTVIILGMGFGEMRNATVNCVAFFNIFLRFLEILMVYEWSEQMRSLRRQILRREQRRIGSYEHDDEDAVGHGETPPPSYSSTLPSASFLQKKSLLCSDPRQEYGVVDSRPGYGTI